MKKQRIISILLAFAILVSVLSALSATAATYAAVPTDKQPAAGVVTCGKYTYEGTTLTTSIYVPKDYNTRTTPCQVVLLLHGYGVSGSINAITQCFNQYSNRIKTLTNDNTIIIAPTIINDANCWNMKTTSKNDLIFLTSGKYKITPSNESDCMKNVISSINELIKGTLTINGKVFGGAGKVDTSKIAVSGYSMGGFGTWDAISRYPNMFSAAFPVCGGVDVATGVSGNTYSGTSVAQIIKNIPIRTYHNTGDPTVSTAGTYAMMGSVSSTLGGQLKAVGAKDAQAIYPVSNAHDAWSAAFTNTTYVKWMLNQTNNNFSNAPSIYGVRVDNTTSTTKATTTKATITNVTTTKATTTKTTTTNATTKANTTTKATAAPTTKVSSTNTMLTMDDGLLPASFGVLSRDGYATIANTNDTNHKNAIKVMRKGAKGTIQDQSFNISLPSDAYTAYGTPTSISFDAKVDTGSIVWNKRMYLASSGTNSIGAFPNMKVGNDDWSGYAFKNTDWETYTIDLTKGAGLEAVKLNNRVINFRCASSSSNTANYFYIDNIKINYQSTNTTTKATTAPTTKVSSTNTTLTMDDGLIPASFGVLSRAGYATIANTNDTNHKNAIKVMRMGAKGTIQDQSFNVSLPSDAYTAHGTPTSITFDAKVDTGSIVWNKRVYLASSGTNSIGAFPNMKVGNDDWSGYAFKNTNWETYTIDLTKGAGLEAVKLNNRVINFRCASGSSNTANYFYIDNIKVNY